MAALIAAATGLPPDVATATLRRGPFAVRPIDEAVIAEQRAAADIFHQIGVIPRSVDVREVAWRGWRPSRAHRRGPRRSHPPPAIYAPASQPDWLQSSSGVCSVAVGFEERIMNTLAIVVVASLAAASAAPAAFAQAGYGGPGGGPAVWTLDARIAEVERSLDKGAADGALDRREYDNAKRVVRDIKVHEREYMDSHGGQLDPSVRLRFEEDLDTIIGQTHWKRQEWRRPW